LYVNKSQFVPVIFEPPSICRSLVTKTTAFWMLRRAVWATTTDVRNSDLKDYASKQLYQLMWCRDTTSSRLPNSTVAGLRLLHRILRP
jgi:hypothetical protein